MRILGILTRSVVLLLVGVSCAVPQQQEKVLTGIDSLEATDFEFLRRPPAGRIHEDEWRIGLLTNDAARDGQGRRVTDVLATAKGLKLAAIYSPEHGLATTSDNTTIREGKDGASGVPVYNLYGAGDAARRPTSEMLAGIDKLVVDLPDIGTRFYTYATTMAYLMEAARDAGIPVVILDRPDPLNGIDVQGPVSNAPQSFVNYFPMPVRHGMTLGELARMFADSSRLRSSIVDVVKIEGWKREQWFDQTGLPWSNPSPAIRSLDAATLYPGVALLEQTNVSVGRGTVAPFEVIGAPWIEPEKLMQYLKNRKIPGIRLESTSFTPESSTHAHHSCQGVRIVVTDRRSLDSPALGIELAAALRRLFPDRFEVDKMDALLANDGVLNKLQNGKDAGAIIHSWAPALKTFREHRERYLLY